MFCVYHHTYIQSTPQTFDMQALHRPTRLKHSHNPTGELVHTVTRKLYAYMRYKRIKQSKR